MSAGMKALFDYRCQNGHIFSAGAAPHGGPWATLVCETCGSTANRHFTSYEEWYANASEDERERWDLGPWPEIMEGDDE